MKTPAEKTSPTSAHSDGGIVAPFAYPPKLDGARAEILASLLAGEAITAKDTFFGSSTMRLAAHVHTLRHDYGWPVLTDDEASDCADGHTAIIARYRLAPETIMAARADGAGNWCEQVHAARAAKRAAKGGCHG